MPVNYHFINGQWISGQGNHFQSINPANGEVVWQGTTAVVEEIDAAVESAHTAFESWVETPLEQRIEILNAFSQLLETNKHELATCISQEMGKPRWEALTEVTAMTGKINISIEAYHQRTGKVQQTLSEFSSIIRHKPHGVIAVFGPYNFPGHLPNGHIVPALLAGNTVIFKPSELTPLVAQKTIELWEAAKIPKGVINLVQGEKKTGKLLAAHDGIDGLLFTGSATTGYLLHQQFSSQPHKILALEMGGNNPLIVTEVANLEAAAYHTIQSAFLTSGQRCTCARRLIVPQGEAGDSFVEQLLKQIAKIRIGTYSDIPEPFMGPVISHEVAQKLLTTQADLITKGGRVLLEMRLLQENSGFLSPGLMDVTSISERVDQEIFGPFLQLIRVKNFEEALQEANNTVYGLSAGLLSDDRELYQKFYRQIRAGIVNWNRPLTGASSSAPFGGIGASGNHRPSAFYAADYCAYPVSSLETEHLTSPASQPPGLE